MCEGYNGILIVNSGSSGAAAGTSFFQFVINQIIYAEQHNLLPWVHFSMRNGEVFDPEVHDFIPTKEDGTPVSFKTMGGATPTEIQGTGDMACFRDWTYPGVPDFEGSDYRPGVYQLKTSGVWDFYFEPISNFQPQKMSPNDELSCYSIPIVDISHPQKLLNNGVHFCAPWAIRGWIYNESPPALKPKEGEFRGAYNLIGEHRAKAHEIVSKYIHPKPWLIEATDKANPIVKGAPPCLAMHIRHTDKGSGRRKVPLEAFMPYAVEYVKGGGQSIYLATDAMENVDRIMAEWPKEVSSKVIRQPGVFLSTSKEPIFHLISHDRANREALIEIYAMSRCGLMVMGYSAMTEAAMYIHGDLHRHSVNLDDPEHATVEEFRGMVKTVIEEN